MRNYHFYCVPFLGIFFLLCSFSPEAFACETIDGLIDYNCNDASKVVITGDSVVSGAGDTVNNNSGGYVKRLNAAMTETKVVNLGISGFTSRQVYDAYRSGAFSGGSKGADIIIIDVGRNDCRDGSSASGTVRNIRRLVSYIRRKLSGSFDSPPYVIVATQIPNRDDRRSCIESLNRALLRNRSRRLPVKLRLDRMSAGVLSSDGLHPDSAGYAKIARKVENFLRGKAQRLIAKTRRDSDSDGVYDHFETKRYGTDPQSADTDGDGVSDGDEIFVFETDPLTAD